MKLTINEVAKKAKVSKTTVSRYLNGKYNYMSEKTKNRIEKIISELDYKPNNMARSLKKKESKIIGCIIADIENPFSNYIFKGINEVCKLNEYRVLVIEISNNKEDEIEAIKSLISYNVDGLIINTTGANDDYLIDLKNTTNVPIVLADRTISKPNILDVVTSDNYKATTNLMNHLYDQGYEIVAFFGYSLSNNNTRKLRYDAYLDSMKNLFNTDGLDTTYIFDNKNSENCLHSIKEFIENNKNKRVAIFTINAIMLLEVLRNIKKLNYDIEKDDIGISSFDDWGWAELIDKSGITTINQKSFECGVKCAELLLERIANPYKNVEYIELPTKLMIRGSTKNKE